MNLDPWSSPLLRAFYLIATIWLGYWTWHFLKRPSAVDSNVVVKLMENVPKAVPSLTPPPPPSPLGAIPKPSPSPTQVVSHALPPPAKTEQWRPTPRQQFRSPVTRDEVLRIIDRIQGPDFSEASNHLVNKYGEDAFHDLIQIGLDKNETTARRYVAMMVAVRIGGASAVSKLEPLAGDSNPFIRRGLCLACSVISEAPCPSLASRMLIEDKAAIVRDRCLGAIKAHHPPDLTQTLEKALDDPRNYVRDNPMPIVYRVLELLQERKAEESVPLLCRLAQRNKNLEFRKHLARAIDAIEQIPTQKLREICLRYVR